MPRRFGVTIDCRDPRALAAFWRLVLDFENDPAPEGYLNWAECWPSATAPTAFR